VEVSFDGVGWAGVSRRKSASSDKDWEGQAESCVNA
jgi:hypothetical protein